MGCGWSGGDRHLLLCASLGTAVSRHAADTDSGRPGRRLAGYEYADREAAAGRQAGRRLQLERTAWLVERDNERAGRVEAGAADDEGISTSGRLRAQLDRQPESPGRGRA